MTIAQMLQEIETLTGTTEVGVHVHGLENIQRLEIESKARENGWIVQHDDPSGWTYLRPSDGRSTLPFITIFHATE